MDDNVLKEFTDFLKKEKYKGIVQELKLEYNDEELFIYLASIKIRKKCRCQGYGSAVMYDITRFADVHHLEVRLYALNIFGSDLKRLYAFYRKHGFVLIHHNNDGKFVYKPKNILQSQ
jgi:N-acetylglutamate synthase-like GNAT family acetyltransferase